MNRALLETATGFIDVVISESDIKELAEKLSPECIKEFAHDYNLSLELAKHDLAEYILYNNKINS